MYWGLSLVSLKYAAGLVLLASYSALLVVWLCAPDQPLRTIGPALQILVSAATLLLLFRGKIRLALSTLVWSSWAIVTLVLFFFGGVRGTLVVLYPLIVILCGWLLGMRNAITLAMLSIVTTVTLVLAEQHLPNPPTTPAALHGLIQVLCIFFSLLLIVFIVRTYHTRLDEIRIAATAFESQEGMMITDADRRILRVNAAFSRITGYSFNDVVGQTPAQLKSGRHDETFYRAMWESIASKSSWQGEIWNRRKSGEVYPEWLTITAVKDSAGRITHYIGTLTDITQRKTAEEEIRNLAFFDPLTRLPNRRLLLDRLQQALASSARSGRQGALLFLDLDHFKTLNDTLGHDIGDLLLQRVAQRLSTCIREGDTVARFGGDEFVVMLVDLSTIHEQSTVQAEAVGKKILTALGQPYDLTGHEYHSTASVGITIFSNHQSTPIELIKQADLAMYAAKGTGRNTLRFFDPEMHLPLISHTTKQSDLT